VAQGTCIEHEHENAWSAAEDMLASPWQLAQRETQLELEDGRP